MATGNQMDRMNLTPAISSASSTARWMALTVDSILTTTPSSSRETDANQCQRLHFTVGVDLAYHRDDLEVPISSPTIICLPIELFITTPIASARMANPWSLNSTAAPCS